MANHSVKATRCESRSWNAQKQVRLTKRWNRFDKNYSRHAPSSGFCAASGDGYLSVNPTRHDGRRKPDTCHSKHRHTPGVDHLPARAPCLDVGPRIRWVTARPGSCLRLPQVHWSEPMHQDRTFDSLAFYQAGQDEPPRVVITETPDAAVVCWHVEPGQRISLHVHPSGQDTWVIMSGEGLYFEDEGSAGRPLRPGVVAVAPRGAVHGAANTGQGPLRFISVVAPAESGFEPVPA